MKVAVVILNHKTCQDSLFLVEQIRMQDKSDDIDIYIADNSLNNDEISSLKGKEIFLKYKVIELDSNLGYSHGNNIGIRAAIADGHEYFIVCNPDVRIDDKNIIQSLVNKYSKVDGPFLVGPKVYNPHIGKYQSPLKFPNFFLDLLMIRGIGRKDERKLLIGCFLFFNREFFNSIGGFPEQVFMYNEETIMYLNGIKNNAKIIYDEDHQIIHSHEKNFNGFGSELRRKRTQLESTIYVMSNYFGYKPLSLLTYKVIFWMRAWAIISVKIIYGIKLKRVTE